MRGMRLLCGAAIMLAGGAFAQEREAIIIGTGERGDNYYAAGGAICRIINTHRPRECATSPTGGSIDNIYALDLMDVDFAVVQGDVQDVAYRGAPAFTGSPYANLRSVATIYEEALTIVTRADSGIERFLDLRGRSVSAGLLNAGSRWTFISALSASGLRIRDLGAFVPMSVMDGASRLCSGQLDALALVTGHPSATLWWLAQSCSIRFVRIDPAISNTMARRNRTYRPIMIPGSIYPFLNRPTPTVGTSATIVTLASTPDENVRDVLGAIYGDVAAFQRQQFVLDPALPSKKDLTAPLHPAAMRFYREYDLLQ